MTSKIGEKSFENFSYFKIIIAFTLPHTGPPYIKRNGTKRRETD